MENYVDKWERVKKGVQKEVRVGGEKSREK